MITLARCQEMADQIAETYGFEKHVVVFNNRITRTWGRCGRKSRTIWLSLKFCMTNSEQVIYDLLKHEIAHSNPEAIGHDKVFKDTCRSMGISEHTFIDHPEAVGALKYIYECPVCHGTDENNVRKVASCGVCSPGVYNEKFRVIVRENPKLKDLKIRNIRRRNLR